MRRKRNRLPLDVYRQRRLIFITICTFHKHKYFYDVQLSRYIINQLKRMSDKFHIQVIAYVVMPNHIHLLIDNNGNDVIRFMKQFKQVTGYTYKKNNQRCLWQKSYYDHVLRAEESVISIIRYIVKNPVRAGLVNHWIDYPYCGSFVFDLESVISMES